MDRDELARALFLNAAASVLVAVVGGELARLTPLDATHVNLHSFLPIAAGSYLVVLFLGSAGLLQVVDTVKEEAWSWAARAGAAWSFINCCLSFYGLLQSWTAYMHGA